jgi:hypothetical protein
MCHGVQVFARFVEDPQLGVRGGAPDKDAGAPVDFVGAAKRCGLNLIEGFFSKLARSVLRHIRVASKQELKDRIMAATGSLQRKTRRPYMVLQLKKAA